MLDIMYEVPKDDTIGSVVITGDYIRGEGAPIIRPRGQQALPDTSDSLLPEGETVA